ncbi:Collagen alpha-1(XIV) chain [Talaromyces islandicus]|uniref:Collagen alpha-1(XIV) chain n=1 Tax=Talaromyces islandicus TaxID=28573 RepID=A0A0U1LVU1_TALIS|nr:Collagen alpha-1(XIV) chain [Talaromyces islandicus]
MEITVGQVTGVINLWVGIVGITLPLGIAYVLSWWLAEENNAATWSVATRILQATFWPSIIGADSASSKRVSWLVFGLGWGITIGHVLVSLTGVITPLGLHDHIRPTMSTPVPFVYVPDESPYGLGTPRRPDAPFSRSCGGVTDWVVCPGSNGTDAYVYEDGKLEVIPNNGSYTARLPYNLTQIFSSASSGVNSTVSGPFDIQYRQQFPRSIDAVDKGKPYMIGSWRAIDNLILHNKIEAIEGMIVDSTTGGVGYRNHTMPANLPHGGRWTEDITWIEPLVECVNTNLTIRFTLNYTDLSGNIAEPDHVRLKDKGGFSNLPLKGSYHAVDDAQADPELRERATQLAFFHNGMLMWALGLTGANFSVHRNITPDAEYPLVQNDSYLDNDYQNRQYQPDSIQVPGAAGIFQNHNLSSSNENINLRTAISMCDGSASQYTGEFLDNQTVGIDCGLLLATPRRLDSPELLIYSAGSEWEQDIYMCASAVQASIKTVEFMFNGTNILTDLTISSVKDKLYNTPPLWAIEITGQPTQVTSALWGPIDNKYEHHENLIIKRSERLLLPPADQSSGLTDAADSMAALHVPMTAQHMAIGTSFLESITPSSQNDQLPITDYTGHSNFALSRRWQQLSVGGHEGAATILRLIFTDILASATIGSQSPIGLSGSDTHRLGGTVLSGDVKVPIEPFQRKIEYELAYAIPAFITLLLWILVLVALLIALVLSRFSFSKLRQQLNLSSVGRLYTNVVYPDACEIDAKTKVWIEQAGGIKFRLDRKVDSNPEDPSAESQLMGA